MGHKVLFDGNGSGIIQVVGLGLFVPAEKHNEVMQKWEQAQAERDALAKEVDAANDRNAELVEQRDALAAQVVHLHEKLDKALDLILRADIDWYLDGYDDTWITEALAEHAKGIPDAQQCLREVQAEAGRKGFIACFHQQKLIYILDDQLETRADQYAATVRQGGAA